jgi:decaprenylphosphoryl-5-phosphoribose phosphatase
VLRSLDLALLRLLRTRGHPPALERRVAAFSRLGEHGILWYLLAVAGTLLRPSQRAAFARCARVTAMSFVCNQVIKLVVRRRRPELEGLPPLTSTISQRSYPSAHATTSFAAARCLSRLVPAAPLYALATAMALSRLYLGVHHPSDALAGAALGDAVAKLAR